MPTFNTTDPKPGYVYDQSDDTWYPLVGIAPGSSISRWSKTATGGETSVSGTGDDSTTLAYTAGTEQVFLNGVLLVRGSDYTATNGTSITGFSPALSASDIVEVIILSPSNIQITDAVLETDVSAKGDLFVGTAENSYGILTAGTNGYVLKTNSATTSGLEWSELSFGSSIVFEGATADSYETTLQVTDPTDDRTITLPNSSGTVALTSDITITASSTSTFTNKTLSLSSNTVTSTLAELNTAVSDADVASLAGSETLTNKTLTSPTINGGTLTDAILKGTEEDVNVVASAATGTINFDIATASIWYYTSNASANHTLNIRYDSSNTLNSKLATGDAITVVWMNTNGATPYYPNVIQIDGNAVTPKVPAAISAGNASAIDVYSFTIIKTASATFTVLETQTKFA